LSCSLVTCKNQNDVKYYFPDFVFYPIRHFKGIRKKWGIMQTGDEDYRRSPCTSS